MQESLEDARRRMEEAQSKLRSDEAFNLVDARKYSQALPLLQECRSLYVDAFPDMGASPAIEMHIGKCYEALGDKPNAIEAYNRTLQAIGQYPTEKQERGFGHIHEEVEEALQRLENS